MGKNYYDFHRRHGKFKHKSKIHISTIILYTFLIALACATFFPFYWMIIQATHNSREILTFPPPLTMGDKIINNYQSLLESVPFWRAYLNSIIIASSITILSLFFCSIGGYAFAMYYFPGKKILFSLLLLTMMIPWVVSIIPWFIILSKMGWINTYQALIVPSAVYGFGIFWMRQYISSHSPKELLDAARIDGCSEFSIFFRIFFPIITPAYGILGLLTFLSQWNSYLLPSLILQSRNMFTIPVAIKYLSADPYKGMDFGVVMCGTTMAIGPVIVVFIFSAKQFMAGLTAGALKG